MEERIVTFDLSDEDTCMKQWEFTVQGNGKTSIIQSIKIKPSGEGCVGHPKTIMALVRDTPVSALDTERLAATKCVRTKSCGMSLASCVDAIASGNSQP